MHCDQYLHFFSHHPFCCRTLLSRATTHSSSLAEQSREESHVYRFFLSNGYTDSFIQSCRLFQQICSPKDLDPLHISMFTLLWKSVWSFQKNLGTVQHPSVLSSFFNSTQCFVTFEGSHPSLKSIWGGVLHLLPWLWCMLHWPHWKDLVTALERAPESCWEQRQSVQCSSWTF